MSHIHYKFSSKLDYDTVVFDRLYVSLKDLKSQIMGREKLRVGDCDLQITNAQSKEGNEQTSGLHADGLHFGGERGVKKRRKTNTWSVFDSWLAVASFGLTWGEGDERGVNNGATFLTLNGLVMVETPGQWHARKSPQREREKWGVKIAQVG